MDAAASGDLHRTKRLQRTAKSCGPGAATLASSRWSDPEATVAKQAAHRGEHEGNRKTIARGKSGLSRLYLSNPCAFFHYQRTRCCGRSRRPAFPAPSIRERGKELAKLRRNSRRENENACSSVPLRASPAAPHPEERQSRVSKDGRELDPGLMVRDAKTRSSP
jgi:hypothetical protein